MVNLPHADSSSSATAETVRLTGACGTGLQGSTFLPPPPAAHGLPTLLYTHGFGQTRGAWHKTGLGLAAQGYAGLAYDARGHGGSQRNAHDLPYDAEQFIDDLIIVAGEQPEPPVLIGASMGGLFGLIAESRWPGLFSALVLVDITPHWEKAGLSRVLEFATAFPSGFESPAQAAELVANYLPNRPRRSAEELIPLMHEGEDGRWRWHWDMRLIDDLVRDSAQHQDDIAEAARSVRCPVLLVSGGRSEMVSEDNIRSFQALVPHAQHVQLPQAGHMLAGDDNDAFTGAVLDYLGTLSRARHTRFFNTAFDSASGARS
ncbi:Pimeloyl-ACP methyl ester carboxylesterase [Pseudoxanthomonas sp. GM95]|uniref:alpha/beta fold hydrolase n=1 Tax=Pseudoxanthomonas sp. GM95 TaxID=1881043 RepID=UPI0008AC5F1C|nr:alpha/beta hydrolase [Pseudoxanthomonas sp. GM95]SEL69513.1 Pimeloyl-ACP methyl ester carboxylesterase [Pseudoxanthomonas sp. GM95]